MTIVGLGGILSAPSCAVLRDGKIAAAAEERKVARRHELGRLPVEAMRTALDVAKVRPDEVEYVALARPFSNSRAAEYHLELQSLFPQSRLVLVEHHTAHAASAYYPSPFDDALVLTLDRFGDFRCGARWQGRGSELQLERELYYPDSPADVYSRVTGLLGFTPSSDEHKVQWLSTSGDDRFVKLFETILFGVWPRLDRSYFDNNRLGSGGFSAKFYEGLGLPDGAEIPASLQAHVAAGVQRATENALLMMAGDAPRVCLAGGLAFNALLVAKLEQSREVFVQPVAGNAGTALGAVYHVWHNVLQEKTRVPLPTLSLGPAYDAEACKQVLENCKLRFQFLQTNDELIATAVRELNDNRIVAWMQGRMEFGPRALGNRSILASPLNPYSTENLNVFIKHREPFRKFAASIPAEVAGEYFDVGANAPFLATVGRVKPKHRETFASAILGDDLVRVHTVREDENPLYYKLLRAAGQATGLPVLYNTSFNLFSDPMVCTPRDAVRSFYSSGIDAMFVDHFFLQK